MKIFNNAATNLSIIDTLMNNDKSGMQNEQAKALFYTLDDVRNSLINNSLSINNSYGKRNAVNGLMNYLLLSQGTLSGPKVINASSNASTVTFSNSSLSSGVEVLAYHGQRAKLEPFHTILASHFHSGGNTANIVADNQAVRRPKRQLGAPQSDREMDLTIQNEHAAYYLQRTGRLSVEPQPNVPRMINTVVESLGNKTRFLPGFTRALLSGTGLYGAQRGEALSVRLQLRQVNDWIVNNIFGGSMLQFLCNKIIEKTSTRHSLITRKQIDNRLLKQIFIEQMMSFNSLSPETMNYLHDKIIKNAMPLLYFKENGESAPDAVGTINWVYQYAGAKYLSRIGINGNRLSSSGLLSLGISLEAMLFSQTISSSIIHFFTDPACFYFLVHKIHDGKPVNEASLFNDPAIRQRAMELFFTDSQQRHEKNNPFIQLSQALEGYRTRTQLAEKIVSERCSPDAGGLFAADVESYKYYYNGYYCWSNCHDGVCTKEMLPNINEEFFGQNQHIAEQYRLVDMLLIAQALDKLGTEEINFLVQNEIKFATAAFSSFDRLKGIFGVHTIPRNQYTIPLSASVTMFSTTGSQERVYALVRQEDGISIKRVDRDGNLYYPLLDDSTPLRDKDYVLKIYAGGSQAEVLKQFNASLDFLVENLASRAQQALRTQLDREGYDATTGEKVLSVVLSMVPFYDCISGMIAGKREAVVPCIIDVFSLIPVIGQAGAVLSGVAVKGGMGGFAAVRISLASYAARQSLRGALRLGVRHFSRYALAPIAAELNQKAFIAMAVEVARFADPMMLETAFRAGTFLSKQMIAATKLVAGRLADIAPILPQLNRLARAKPLTPKAVYYETARLSGTRHYLSVMPLTGIRFEGRIVYVRVNRLTGELYGKKYFLSQDKQLLPVPKTTSLQLQNILQKGLSGRGAGKAARVWSSQRSYDDLVLIDLPQYPNPQYIQIESYGTREAESILFPELGITLQQTPLDLRAYINVFDKMPADVKKAMRLWTLVEDDITRYHDGTKNLAQLGYMPINAEINLYLHYKVPVQSWDSIERTVLEGLLSAIDSPLPRQYGTFMRVAEYKHEQSIPWASSIGPGDIVTNYPALMSVSSKDTYSRLSAEQAAEEFEENKFKSLIYIKIHGGANCLPLPFPVASTVKTEYELIYPPKSFFTVESITNADLVGGEMYPAKRIAVVLKETAPSSLAKNLFSGETFQFPAV